MSDAITNLTATKPNSIYKRKNFKKGRQMGILLKISKDSRKKEKKIIVKKKKRSKENRRERKEESICIM